MSTVGNIATTAMLARFLMTRPNVNVAGQLGANGTVRVDGATVQVQVDNGAIQKVEICQGTPLEQIATILF
jgi:hypothetical protein